MAARVMPLDLRACLLSPALPAWTLVFGMVFCLAISHFAGLSWQMPATVTFYGLLAVWVAILAWRNRRKILPLTRVDWLFILFLSLLVSSAAIHGLSEPGLYKYGRYFPFFMVAPYVCGRLMHATDVRLFCVILVYTGLLLLPLALIDYVWSPMPPVVPGRWPFFGYDHSSLLMGTLLASAVVPLASYMLLQRANPLGSPAHFAILVFVLALTLTAIVWTRARGGSILAPIGAVLLCLTAHWLRWLDRVWVPLFVVGVISIALMMLPATDRQFFGNLLNRPLVLGIQPVDSKQEFESPTPDSQKHLNSQSPVDSSILGPVSCRALEVGTDSVAIRWTLYQEAIAVFLKHPYWGAGPASFGKHSCTGELGFPHSTVLQVFAELGAGGGTLYLVLLGTVFFSLIRRTYARPENLDRNMAWVALALFVTFLALDQIYGNYFMAAGTYLLSGLAAGIYSWPGSDRQHGEAQS